MFANDALKGQIENIAYRNIQVYDDADEKMPPIQFIGYNAEHTVKNVKIEGVYYNGERITDPSIIDANEFTGNIQLK